MFSISDQLIGYHEVGHAIAFHCLGIEFIFVQANTVLDDCSVTRSSEGAVSLNQNPRKKAIIALSGPAAEMAMASKFDPRFDFDEYFSEHECKGWRRDICMATESAPNQAQNFRAIARDLRDVSADSVAVVGEELVPLLLSRGGMVPAAEVYAVFERHEDLLTHTKTEIFRLLDSI